MPNETPVVTPTPDTTLADSVMDRIHTGKANMKPRWYFVLGSAALFTGLVGLVVTSVFFVSFITFFLRSHGPRGAERLAAIAASFPWWALLLGLLGIISGVLLLRRYDFSYKKNFAVIVLGLVFAILAAGWLVNALGLDQLWMKRGPMRGFYQQYDSGQGERPGPGWHRGENDRNR
ncbi:MAG: hypothetical protein WBP40_03445 [Candidatus Moraniibacteriota bacterium]